MISLVQVTARAQPSYSDVQAFKDRLQTPGDGCTIFSFGRPGEDHPYNDSIAQADEDNEDIHGMTLDVTKISNADQFTSELISMGIKLQDPIVGHSGKIYNKGAFKMPKTSEGFVSLCNRLAKPECEKVDSSSQFAQKQVSWLGVVIPSVNVEAYENFAQDYAGDFKFLYTIGDSIEYQMGHPEDAGYVYIETPSSFSIPELEAFFLAHRDVAITEFSLPNYTGRYVMSQSFFGYSYSASPQASYVWSPTDQKRIGDISEDHSSKIESLIGIYHDLESSKRIPFFYDNYNSQTTFTKPLDLPLSEDSLVIFNGAAIYVQPVKSDVPFVEQVVQFIEDFHAGKLSKRVKSTPAPEEPTVDGLTTVVHSTFDEHIMNNEKPTFTMFSITRCGYCVQLYPIWVQFADDLNKKYPNQVGINTMQVDKNDLPEHSPFKIEGYPSLILYKPATKEIVYFNKQRTAEDFYEFLKANNVISKPEAAPETPVVAPATAAKPFAEDL